MNTSRFVTVVVVTAIVGGLMAWFLVDAINRTTQTNSADASRAAVAQTQINGCNNRQVRDGYLRSLTEQIPTTGRSPRENAGSLKARNDGRANAPVLDCEATYAPGNQGVSIRLPPVLGLCFIGLVSKGYFSFDRTGPLQRHLPFTNPKRLEVVCRAEGTYEPAYNETQRPTAGVDYQPVHR